MDSGMPIRLKSLFHKPAFRKLMSLPCWGGTYSYITIETDPAQELECIRTFHATATLETRLAILGPVLTHPPATIDDALEALLQIYPRVLNEVTDDTKNETQKRIDWIHILKAAPIELNELLAAWNRLERDQIYQEVNSLEYLSPITVYYFNFKVNAIKRQEERWKQGAQMGFGERLLFWLWGAIMQLVVVVPDTISVFLGAVLAVFRSGPIRLQSQIIAIAIWDFPWADERLARFIAFQRYLGILPTALFGLCAVFNLNYHRTAFHSIWNLGSKAAICITWQMLMHNWNNLFDLHFSQSVKRLQLATSEVAEIRDKHDRLKRCNAYAYAWFETFKLSNRFGAQVSYHKEDHQDALNALKWAGGLNQEPISFDELRGKSLIWAAFITIECLICVSTFPTDPYAGLIALAYFGPLIARAGLDVWDPSQGLDDLIRLFTTTAGPTFPSTVLVLMNMVYIEVTKKLFFAGFRGYRFAVAFVVLFILSLYPRLWAEMFKCGISWIQDRFLRRSRQRNELHSEV